MLRSALLSGDGPSFFHNLSVQQLAGLRIDPHDPYMPSLDQHFDLIHVAPTGSARPDP